MKVKRFTFELYWRLFVFVGDIIVKCLLMRLMNILITSLSFEDDASSVARREKRVCQDWQENGGRIKNRIGIEIELDPIRSTIHEH